MSFDPGPIDDLVKHLSRLPGIGEKTATRLAYFILKQSTEDVRALAEALVGVKERIALCERCFNLTDTQPCRICADATRDQAVICVVEQPPDVAAFEKAGAYNGVYHVLHGALSPLDQVGPEALHLAELVERVKSGAGEVVIATNPNREGEATAHYIADMLRPLGVKISRIAHGVPVGSEVEYADSVTLGLALSGRREF
ncbi:MAG: recombination protein RecR [Deltaproteobacteria bacterium]|nr:recombination protein RecR [Deltaproteobacteria bacterium]